MTLTKPKKSYRRVYVSATDAETRKSQSLTVYGATADQVIAELKRLAKDGGGMDRETKRAASSAT